MAEEKNRPEKDAQPKKGWIGRLLDWITQGNRRAAELGGQCPT